MVKKIGDWELQVEMVNCDRYETCTKVKNFSDSM